MIKLKSYIFLILTFVIICLLGQGCEEHLTYDSGSIAGPNRPTVDKDEDVQNESPNGNESPSAKQVPMFVAVGRGGRTMMSCDDGRTWIADRSLSNDNSDHSATVDKGFAYGNGVFIQSMGWGYDTSIQRSEDGVNWETIDFDKRITNLVHTENSFVLFASGAFASYDGGLSWQQISSDVNHGDHAREGGGGSDENGLSMIAVISGANITYSIDEGNSWTKAPSKCEAVDSFGGIGQRGGADFADGVFVAVDDEGDFCTTHDLGATWENGSIENFKEDPIKYVGKMQYAAPYFWSLAGSKIHRSLDGLSWETKTVKPLGVTIHAIAVSDKGTYVGFDRSESKFYRSSDGINWSLISNHPNELTFQRLLFGYASPSDRCSL